MKIRTISEFNEALDSDFAWRQKELIAFNIQLSGSSDKLRPMYIRSGICLLYAHWEGFIKTTSEYYLSFISNKKLRYNELSFPLLALALRFKFKNYNDTNTPQTHISFIHFLLKSLHSPATIPKINVMEIGANLNSECLKKIIIMLGLDYSEYKLNEDLIDNQLLHWRNNIAHGQFVFPKNEDFNSLYQTIIKLIRHFKDQISNAVSLEEFKIKSN